MAPRCTPAGLGTDSSSSRLAGGGDGIVLHDSSLVKVGVVLAMADGAKLYVGSPDVVVGDMV
jgi:hypothetical protein